MTSSGQEDPAKENQSVNESALSGQGVQIGTLADGIIRYAHDQVMGEAIVNMAKYGWSEEFAMQSAKPRIQLQQMAFQLIGQNLASVLDRFGAGVGATGSAVADYQFLLAQDDNELGTQPITNLVRHFVTDNGKDIVDIASSPTLFSEWQREFSSLMSSGRINEYYTVPGSASISGLMSALTGSKRSDPYLDAQIASNAVNRKLFSQSNYEETTRMPASSESERVLAMWMDRSATPVRLGSGVHQPMKRSPNVKGDNTQEITDVLQQQDRPIGTDGPPPSSEGLLIPIGRDGSRSGEDRHDPSRDGTPVTGKPRSGRGNRLVKSKVSNSNLKTRLNLSTISLDELVKDITGTDLGSGRAVGYLLRFQCGDSESDEDCLERARRGIGNGRHLGE